MEAPHPESISPKGDYTREKAKERQYNSKVKNLIYGGDARPDTPVHEGKKSVPHACGGPAPFATHDGVERNTTQGHDSSKAHVAKAKKPQASGLKIGEVDFDPSIYRNNLAANAVNIAASKQKNWGSGQVMPAREEADTPYEIGTVIQTPKNSSITRSFPPDQST